MSTWVARGRIGYGREWIMPTANPVLILNLGSPIRVSTAGQDHALATRTAGWLVGPQTRYLRNEPVAETDVVGATLRPWGLVELLGLAAGDVRDLVVDIDLVWGPGLERLRTRLASQPAAAARGDILRAALDARRSPATPPDVREATRRLAQEQPARVGAVAQELRVSRRHLGRLFDQHVGLTPRTFSRLHRFERTLQALAHPRPTLARVAVEQGFYDQAHMNREFGAFSGLTPSAYLQRRGAHFALDADASGLFVPGP